MNNIIQFRVARKKASTQVTQINSQITRKPMSIETVFIKVVRERIARDWRRGVTTRDLAAQYRVSRTEIENIVHEELFPQKGAA